MLGHMRARKAGRDELNISQPNPGPRPADAESPCSPILDLHGEDGFLRDSEERGGAGKDEDEESEEDVHGHVGGAQVRGQPREEERDEATDPLHEEHDDGGDAHPRVQAVETRGVQFQ